MQYSKAWLFNVPTWDIFKVLSRLEHEPKQYVPISRKSSWNWTLGKLEQLANVFDVIGDYAFYRCSGLDSLEFQTIPSINVPN